MTNETVFDVDYFLRKFEAIPEDKWCVDTFQDENGRCCAQGFCGFNTWNAVVLWDWAKYNKKVNHEGVELVRLFSKYTGYQVAEINNYTYHKYNQDTPKQRILAALRDIKAKQQAETPTYPDITKSLAILPTEELADKKLKTVKA